jgi:hypothetical protein
MERDTQFKSVDALSNCDNDTSAFMAQSVLTHDNHITDVATLPEVHI